MKCVLMAIQRVYCVTVVVVVVVVVVLLLLLLLFDFCSKKKTIMMSLSFLFACGFHQRERERERERERNFCDIGLFSPKNFQLRRKKNGAHSRDKIREQRERKQLDTRTIKFATSRIPSGALPGGHTHGSSGIPCLRGIDVGLQSVLSADKCPCGACCVRVSRYSFAPEYSTKATPNFFAAKL